MRYKIGDVSKMLGISPDLLRYYEKKGVVHPVKDQSNDYRYYDVWDTNFLIDCLFYKSFGFSVEQTAEMVRQCTVSDMDARFRSNEDALKQLILHSQMLLQRSEEYRDSIEDITQNLGQCTITECPPCIYYANRLNQEFSSDPRLQRVARDWLKYFPFSKRSFCVPRAELVNPATDATFQWGFSLSMEYAEILGAKSLPPVIHVPAHKSVYTTFSSVGNSFSPRLLNNALTYLKENGLTLCGDVRGNLLISALDNSDPNFQPLTGYFEAWLPVE